MKLLNCSVDGLIIKGRLSYLDLEEICQFWEQSELSRQFYNLHFYLNESTDIQLFADLKNRDDPLDFKIRVGAPALILGGYESTLQTLPIQESFIGSVDIAFDYSGMRIAKHLGIHKTIEKFSRKTGECYRVKGTDDVICYEKDGVITGYQIGKRNRLLIRIYDKMKELEAKPSFIKDHHISQYESDDVTRIEFSIVSNFEHKKYPLPELWTDFEYYLQICRKNVLKRVQASTKEGNTILRHFRAVPELSNGVDKDRVGVRNRTLYKMGLGKITASLERYGMSQEEIEAIKSDIMESVTSRTDFLNETSPQLVEKKSRTNDKESSQKLEVPA